MIGPDIIKANAFEKMQLSVGCYCQLALKVKPSKVNEIIHEISNKAIACRNYFDGENYVYTPKQCPIFQIPDNFPSFEEVCTYVSSNYTIPENQRLGCICFNKDTVVLNANHSSSDGGYYKMLANYLTGHQVPNDSYFMNQLLIHLNHFLAKSRDIVIQKQRQ